VSDGTTVDAAAPGSEPGAGAAEAAEAAGATTTTETATTSSAASTSTTDTGNLLGRLFRRGSAIQPPVYGQHHYLVTGAFLVLVALIAPQVFTSRSDQFLVNLWLVYSITGIGFYWVFGLAGKFAFCQTFMMALGGFMSAWLTRADDGPNQPFIVGVMGAVAITCLMALLLGLSVRRAQHFYFAIATLALESIGFTVFKEWTDFTGPNGTTVGVRPASLAGREFLLEDEVFWLFLGTLALVLLLACLIERSPLRREAVAARDNFLVANVAGVRADRHQLVLLVLGSGLGGLSGALIAHWNGVIGIDSFGIDLAIGIFLMLLLGGMHSMWGPVLGAAFYVAVPDLLSDLERYSAMVYGLVLLVVVIAVPEGLVGAVRRLGRFLADQFGRLRQRSGSSSPAGGLAMAVAGAGGAEAVPLSTTDGRTGTAGNGVGDEAGTTAEGAAGADDGDGVNGEAPSDADASGDAGSEGAGR
jgi:branched-chain amino acid transport system permease protein